MTTQRITEVMVHHQLRNVQRLMLENGVTGTLIFYGGNTSNRVTNKLLLGKQNLWPDGMAGFSRKDAYNALRLMAATLGATADAREEVVR